MIQITSSVFVGGRHLRYLLAQSWEQRTINKTPDPTCIRKRSVVIADHPTSITLEDAFWDQLKVIAARNHESLNALVTRIDAERTGNLSSALRIFVLEALSPKA